ncbi:antitoxin [Nonomuraea sp. NPDC050383]|uniref:antitoxin n=1 Tax=Nonomuraea sp. NPDC050383 TaxID=3364362 RepID=UPI003787CEBD
MGIGEWLKKAKDVAKEHSTQTDEALRKAEQFAQERTGHKYDEQIGQGFDAVERTYQDGGEGQTCEAPTDTGQAGGQAGERPVGPEEGGERPQPPRP